MGYYGNNADRTCRFCNDFCETCTGPWDSQCTSCGNSRYLDNTPEGHCIEDCKVGYYGHKIERICYPCPGSCGNCTHICDASYSECHVLCNECSYPKYLDHNNNCVDACPLGSYPSDSPYRQCKYCVEPCNTCNNEHCCTSCINNYLLEEDC